MICSSGLCCCFQIQSYKEERQPILGVPQSTRISHSPPHGVQVKSGRITARHVGVPDLDQHFIDFAEMFNRQQGNYERVRENRKILMRLCNCGSDSSLTDCLQKIKDEHNDHHIGLQIKGYDFSLTVLPEDPIPDKLKRSQEHIKELCQAAKAIMALGPKLEEMINWLLKSEKSLTQKVNTEAKTYLESTRFHGNLTKNMHEVTRAKELSPRYREEAGKLFNEVSMLSGVKP